MTPQKSQHPPLIKSAPVDGNKDASKLVKGNTRHQIFSNSKFIFKISSTLEKLYRYEVDPTTNKVIKIVVFSRVKNGNYAMRNPRNIELNKIRGTAESYKGTRYYVCVNKHFGGYILLARSVSGFDQISSSEIMYYQFEKYEKKEGEY